MTDKQTSIINTSCRMKVPTRWYSVENGRRQTEHRDKEMSFTLWGCYTHRNVLDCVGFSLKEDRLQNVRGSGLLTDWTRTDGRTVLNFEQGDSPRKARSGQAACYSLRVRTNFFNA